MLLDDGQADVISLIVDLNLPSKRLSLGFVRHSMSRGTNIGPLRGSELAVKGRAKGSPGTGRK